jgi:flagellar biosynthesis/type III secretory pathway chaperone
MSTQELLTSLEDNLVKEFRTLQSLVNLTRSERTALLEGNADNLLNLVEEKESVLDQLGLVEDSRRMTSHQLSQEIGIQTQTYSLAEFVPILEPAIGNRLKRLQEGITVLAEQARELNTGNKALAMTKSEVLDATQAFLLSLFMTPAGYRPPGVGPDKNLVPVWDIEHKA